MRTIGVLGGIGPQATLDFEARVHEVSRRVLPPRLNEGYPPMVTVYLRHAPVLQQPDGTPSEPLTLDPRLLEAAERLGRWADLIVIVSNTPHLFLDRIREAARSEVLSIVDVTVDEVGRRADPPLGLLGLGIPEVYRERLEHEHDEIVVAPPEMRDRLDDAILRLMEGRETAEHVNAAREALAFVRERGARTIVLGCTEIPLLLGESESSADDLVNPAALLAREAVLRAIS